VNLEDYLKILPKISGTPLCLLSVTHKMTWLSFAKSNSLSKTVNLIFFWLKYYPEHCFRKYQKKAKCLLRWFILRVNSNWQTAVLTFMKKWQPGQ